MADGTVAAIATSDRLATDTAVFPGDAYNVTQATVYNASQATTAAAASGFYESFYAEITVLVAIGIVGNGQLIALFQRRHRKVFRAVNLFMLLLAIIDLTACLWTMPYTLLYVSRNLDSEVACKAGFYVSGAIEIMSMMTSTMIAFERFHAVRSPHRPPTSRQAVYARVTGITGFSFLLMSGLIVIITVDEHGECNLNALRPLAINTYLLVLFATIALIYVCDMVLYAFIFAAMRRRGRMQERRRNTLSSISSNGITRQRALQIQSSHNIPMAVDSEKQDISTAGPLATLQQGQLARSISMNDSLHECHESGSVGRRPSETEKEKRDLSVDVEATNSTAITNTTTEHRVGASAAQTATAIHSFPVTSFSKRSSSDSPSDHRASRRLKLQPQPQQLQLQHHPLSAATSPLSDVGRLSWSSEAGSTSWAAQEVRSSAFLIIVLLSLCSWIPFFISMSFPYLLGLDAPHFRFLFFLNHVINIFVYIALSPHVRAQLKMNLLHPIRRCRTGRR